MDTEKMGNMQYAQAYQKISCKRRQDIKKPESDKNFSFDF